MRIGVWNLECVVFRDRNPARLDFLRAREVDVWVLTETHTEIDLRSSHPHFTHSTPRNRSANGMHWVSIWSRFPIERIESDDVRTAIALLDTPVGRLLVYGTVWPWHSDIGEYPGDKAWTNWARQAPVIAQQAEQWSRLKAKYPDSILCIAGDLNMTFGGPYPYLSPAGRLEAAVAMQAHLVEDRAIPLESQLHRADLGDQRVGIAGTVPEAHRRTGRGQEFAIVEQNMGHRAPFRGQPRPGARAHQAEPLPWRGFSPMETAWPRSTVFPPCAR